MVSRRDALGGFAVGLFVGAAGLAYATLTADEYADFTYGDILLQNRHTSTQTFVLEAFRKREARSDEQIFENRVTLQPDHELLFEEIYPDLGTYRIEARTDSGFEDSHSRILVWEDRETGEPTGFRTRIRLSSDLGLNVNGFSEDNPPTD